MVRKLVVVGNGMAGVRAIEEILARSKTQGSAVQFDITVFGDEPYGNYNRIMLSNVLPAAMRSTTRTASISTRWIGTATTGST